MSSTEIMLDRLPANNRIEEAMMLAYRWAQLSPDPSNQNGAVLISCDRVIKCGFNGFTENFKPESEHLERPRKYTFIVHAEQRAVAGVDARGRTLVCPWAACTKCAQCIIESGVSMVITDSRRMATTPDRWQQEIADANLMFAAAGVEVTERSFSSFGIEINVNGESWIA